MLKIDAGLMSSGIPDMVRTAREAERLGFHGLMSVEAAHDPFLPLMIAAEHTSTLELGTAIAVAFPRSPMITAHIAYDLQRHSRGRFLLGLGTQVKGHNERRFSVPWGRPGPRLREVILSLRAIWECWQNGTPLRFEGEFYHFSLMTPFFSPGPHPYGPVPIYIAGVNPYICRLAGEAADGFHVHPLHTVRYLDRVIRPQIAEGAAKAGRDASAIRLVAPAFVIVGDRDEEIEASAAAVRQQIAFYASTRTYRAVLEEHGWEELGPRLHECSQRGDWAGMAALITDDMLAELAVTGPRDAIGTLLRRKYDGRVDRLSLYFPFAPGTADDWWQDVIRAVSA